MTHGTETLLGLRDAAAMLEVSAARLRQLIEDGRLPATKVSSTWIVKESELIAFADQVRPPGRPRLYELILDSSEAHIGIRGGSLMGFCGRSTGAAFTHEMGAGSDVAGVRLCHDCRSQAPRYVVRYWMGRGAL